MTSSEHSARVDLALVAVAAGILTTVWHVQDLFTPLAVLRPAITSILAAAFLLLMDRSPERRERRFATPVTVPLLLFLALTAIFIPASLDPQISSSMLLLQLLPTGGLALMIAMSVRSGRDLEWLVMMNVIGAMIYGGYALVRIPLGPDGKWVNMIGYDNNDFALLTVATVPMALFLVQSGRSWIWKTIGALGCVILLLCIARTGSRGGLLGLAVVLGYLVFRYRTVGPRARTAVVVVGAALVGIAGHAQIANTVNTIRHPESDYNWAGNDYDGRIELWKRGLGYIETHPITGVGLSAFPIAEGQLSEIARERLAHGQTMKALVAHNMYIQVASELGLIAFVVFLFLLWRTYRTFTAIARAYEPAGDSRPTLFGAGPETTLPRLLAASMIGYCFCAIFIAAAYFSLLPVLIGFAGAASRIVPGWVTARQRRGVPALVGLGEQYDPLRS